MPYKDPEKQKKAQREWYERTDKAKRVEQNRNERVKRRRIVNAYKTEHGCNRCGYNDHPGAIEAHHNTGVKNFCISDAIIACKNIDLILAELELCELVCANCHRIEHSSKYD